MGLPWLGWRATSEFSRHTQALFALIPPHTVSIGDALGDDRPEKQVRVLPTTIGSPSGTLVTRESVALKVGMNRGLACRPAWRIFPIAVSHSYRIVSVR